MIKILRLIVMTSIMWLITSIIGGSFNPMEWDWVWRGIAVLWYVAVWREVYRD